MTASLPSNDARATNAPPTGVGLAVMLAASRALGMILSLASGVLSARYFGASAVKDTYLVAENIPRFLLTIFVGGLWSNLIIALTEIGPTTGLAGQRRFLLRTCRTLILVLVPTMLVVLVLAGPILRLAAPGFTEEEIALGRMLMLFTVPGMVANVLFSIIRCLFNARQSFAVPAVTSLILPAISLVTLVALVERLGIVALALGPFLGAVLSLVILGWTAASLRPNPSEPSPVMPRADGPDPGQRQLWLAFVPLTVAANAGQINLLIDNVFASSLPTGSIAMLGFAFVILSSTEILTTHPLAEIALSFLADSATRDRRALADSARRHLRFMAIVTLPLAAGFLTFGTPVVRLLFERGEFAPAATQGVAALLACYALEIPLMGYGLILYRVLLVCRRQRAIAIVAVASMAANVALDYLLMLLLGLNGIALATTFVTLLYVLALARLARQDLPQIHDRSDFVFLGKVIVASAMMGVIVLGFRMAAEGRFDLAPDTRRIVEVAVGLGLAAMVYTLGLVALRVREARSVLQSFASLFTGLRQAAR